ncbi:FkbM family methyltransferase [Stenotrophomonas sp.]|uniref:FkbM family methyltransferase n=1 Tax=Stenotrophomonas sp. TaxID=69392 RepID=UPI002D4A7AB7|nr:FkbM family methyltransferase [Stenotrophomonas sp.]HYQ23624.1 FkbM family methyltransferase [Stenotrophomonas sp.]
MKDGIVSYAQNFEDVILWRALGHVGRGNYVDVGAQSAYEDSVSRAFHEQGWKGVHVEPMPFYADQLRQERPGDVVMQVMVGQEEGIGALYAMSGTGLSTSREDLAEGYERDGREVTRVVVPVVTLDQVLTIVEGDVHWLKIDVEGAEKQVLQGWHGALRPWVLVIESTRPMSQEQNYEEWDALVVEKGYRFVYFDGLNRFYISHAHPELADAFQVGPNVFDRFELSGTATSTFAARLKHEAAVAHAQTARVGEDLSQVSAELSRIREELSAAHQLNTGFELRMLHQRLEASERHKALLADQAWAVAHATRLQEELMQAKARENEVVAAAISEIAEERDLALSQVTKLHSELTIIHNSTSWVVTAPMRVMSRVLRLIVRAPVKLARRGVHALKPAVKRVVFGVLRRASRSPRLRRTAGNVLASMPALDARVRAWHGAALGRPVAVMAAPQAFVAVDSTALRQRLDEPLPADASAQAKQGLLRVRHAMAGART